MGQVAARKLEFRVFLEGIEVPCISANLSINFDAPATCAVQCIPTPHSTRLKPRTSIHVFFKDLTRSDEKAPYLVYFIGEIVGYQFAKTPTSISIVYQALDDSSYWDTAYQYYTDYGRGSDWLFRHKSSFMGTGQGLFDSVFREHASVIGDLLRTSPKSYPQLKGLAGGVVHIIEAVGGIPGKFRGFNDFFTMAEMRRKIMAQIVASEADETSGRVYNYKVFWQWLMRQLGSAGSMVSIRDMIKLLFQYIFHNVVPNPIALYSSEGQKDIRVRTVRQVNTTKGKKSLAMLKDIERACVDAIKASNEAYSVMVNETIKLRSLLKRGRERVVTYAPLRYRSVVPNAGSGVSDVGTSKQRISEAGLGNLAYASTAKVIGERMKSVSAAYERVKNITRIRAKALSALVSSRDLESKLQSAVQAATIAYNVPRDAVPYMQRIRAKYKKSVDKSLANPAVFFGLSTMYAPTDVAFSKAEILRGLKLPNYKIVKQVARATYWAEKTLRVVQQIIRELGGKTLSLSTDFTRKERLHNQIFRPDVWFVSPPRCNVLFPEDYISFQYSRNFLQEVTRMELTTAMEIIGSNIVTNSRYTSPDIQDITGTHTLSSSKGGVRLILPHEIYTGILPKFEFMSEANIYAAKGDQKKALNEQAKLIREQQRYLNEEVIRLSNARAKASADSIGKSNPQLKGDEELINRYKDRIKKLQGRAESLSVGGIPYIKRVVNWMYFKQRFASRAMGAQCHFTPRLVAGFPGVIINRPKLQIDDTPPHFLGMIVGLAHSGSQSGGVTSVSFSEAREHGGIDVDDEFLGLEGGVDQTLRREKTKTTNVVTASVFKSVANARADAQKLSKLKSSPKLAKLRRDRARKELTKNVKIINFIVAYERNRSQGKGYKGMKGPNGGVVVKIKRGSGTAKPPTGTRIKSSGTPVVLSDANIKLIEQGVNRQGVPPNLDYASSYAITEKFTTIQRKVFLPPEEQIYPTWMSPVYRNEQIGADKVNGNRPGIYKQFFGVKAITTDPADTKEGRKVLNAALADPTRQVSGSLKPSKTIAEAIDELAEAYASARKNGLDIRSFIDEYTGRPIATLEDILGSSDFEMDSKGKTIKGKPGFHSFAFGDFDKLEGFRNASAKLISGRGKEGKTARQLDTRKKKREAVLKYRAELNKGSGQLGG